MRLVMNNLDRGVFFESQRVQVSIVQFVLLHCIVPGIIHSRDKVLVIDGGFVLQGNLYELGIRIHVDAILEPLLVHALHLGQILADPDCAGWANQSFDVDKRNIRGILQHLLGSGEPYFGGNFFLVLVAIGGRGNKKN